MKRCILFAVVCCICWSLGSSYNYQNILKSKVIKSFSNAQSVSSRLPFILSSTEGNPSDGKPVDNENKNGNQVWEGVADVSKSIRESVTGKTSSSFENLPNNLSIARVFMIPLFMAAFVLKRRALAFGLYFVSCITDFLDGYIARKYNLSSAFGAFVDPVADKLMVAAALIMLATQLPTFWFSCPVAIIMYREIGVSALREWMAERGQRETVKVGSLGKLKTTMQMISTSLLLLGAPGASVDFDICSKLRLSRPFIFSSGMFTLYLSTFLTSVSGLQYFQAAWPKLIAESRVRRNIKGMLDDVSGKPK